MKTFQKSHGLTFQININLLLTAGMFSTALAIWPSSTKWWGLGVISIILGVFSISTLVKAAMLMTKRYAKDKTLSDYLAQGRQPKSSAVVSSIDLDNAGMR